MSELANRFREHMELRGFAEKTKKAYDGAMADLARAYATVPPDRITGEQVRAHVARLSTVGEMVVELAHELNQPLSAICSYAQACKRLLQGSDPNRIEEMSASLNQVSEQADRAAEIIRRDPSLTSRLPNLQPPS